MTISSPEVRLLIDLLKNKDQSLTAMLAPSFLIDFHYPEIIGKLKRLGFKYVVEVARGAVETNNQVMHELKSNPSKRVITSPCPSCVNYIKVKRKELIPFISSADSPMTASAKLVLNIFPNTKPVFIGPCLTKKLEAKEKPELNILVITYQELIEILKIFNIGNSLSDLTSHFDLLGPATRLYAISGGLCQSAGVNEWLTKEEYREVSGLHNLDSALDEFMQDKKIRLLDILFCDGGCINGPGIVSQDSLDIRRLKIIKFWANHLNNL